VYVILSDLTSKFRIVDTFVIVELQQTVFRTSSVTTAWRVLRLRMEETASIYGV
jgi:hypothetical protein